MKRLYKNRVIEISAFILIMIIFIQITMISINLYNKNKNLETIKKANNFSKRISEVLHKTQQERGAGAGYLGKPSKDFKSLYLNKIKLTDKSINKLLKETSYCKKISIQNIKKYFIDLKVIRKEVLTNKISLEKEIKFYSKMNGTLLETMGNIVLIINNSNLLRNFSSYKNFEMAKERVGIERAVLSGTFSQNKWNNNLHTLYINLLAEQNLLFKEYTEKGNEKIRNKFYTLKNSEVFKKVERIEKVALNKKDNFNINSLAFYNIITNKINILNKIAIDISELNDKIVNKIQHSLWVQFLYQLLIALSLVTFLFYTLFLFYKEQKILYLKSTKDKLTNLYNREFLIETFPKFKKNINKNNTKLALFFMDLDGSKEINDTYGHDAGDIVLIETAKKLKKIFRGNDIVVRLGGDEFIILAECVKYDNLKIIANKIINEILKPITLKNGDLVKVGVSIGIAVYPDDADNMEKLIKRADEAMYFSKRSGKGIYTFYN